MGYRDTDHVKIVDGFRVRHSDLPKGDGKAVQEPPADKAVQEPAESKGRRRRDNTNTDPEPPAPSEP